MTEDDRMRFAALMTSLGVAFDLEVPTQRMRLYFEALQGFRVEALEWAAREVIATRQWFPRAAELRELALIAPVPDMVSLPEPQKKLEPPTSPDEARKKLLDVAKRLNADFGTSFFVDESFGRPVLVSGNGGR